MWSISRRLWLVLLLTTAVGAQTVNLDTNVKGSRWPGAGTESGSGNAFVVTTFSPLGPVLRVGSRIEFIATHANTGAATLAVDGSSAIPIKKAVSTALSSGDIANGAVVIVVYDGTNFQCTTCSSGGGGSSVTVNGVSVSSPDFNDTTPAAASNNVNVTWQQSSGSVSAQVGAATGTVLGVVKSLSCTNQFFRSLTTGTGAFNCATVDLANDVTGNLAVSHLNGGTSASSSTFWRGDGTWVAPVTSFTGDGTLISNSGSTGAVTATLANASAYTIWGRHAGTSGAPSYAAVDLAHEVTGLLPIANGGTATASPGLVAGTNVTISGSWPNQTINSTNSGGGSSIGNVPAYGGTYCTNSSTAGGANFQTCPSLFNVVAHQLIVMLCAGFNTGGITASDAGPGGGSALTWNSIASVSNAGNNFQTAAFWADPGSASGSDTFKCNFVNSTTFTGMIVSEVVGATLSSPVDSSTTKAASGTQEISLSPSSTSDITFFVLGNSGTATQPLGFFLPLNDTSVAFSGGWGFNGPYNFQVGMGSNGALVAFAIH